MNDTMRRYLDEEWEDDEAPDGFQRTRKQNQPPPPTDRRQQGKAWGKAINKFHKDRKKQQQHEREKR